MSRDILPERCTLPDQANRANAAEVVQAEPRLEPAEKEFIVRFPADQEFATIFSEIPSTVRRLLTHSQFGIRELKVYDEERFGKSLHWDDWRKTEPPITGVEGCIPIGAVKIQGSPRSENFPSYVVSDYAADENSIGGDSP